MTRRRMASRSSGSRRLPNTCTNLSGCQRSDLARKACLRSAALAVAGSRPSAPACSVGHGTSVTLMGDSEPEPMKRSQAASSDAAAAADCAALVGGADPLRSRSFSALASARRFSCASATAWSLPKLVAPCSSARAVS